jgi:hypothetical protein
VELRDGNQEFGDELIEKIFKPVHDCNIPEN